MSSRHRIRRHVVFLLILGSVASFSQPIVNPSLLTTPWTAMWIAGEPVNIWTGVFPESLKRHAVYKFRKVFDVGAKPDHFVVHVSADTRYKLYVNGTLVSLGPARGDLLHWNFETVDIAPLLVVGKNSIASLVWNEGPTRPEAQITLMTAFILQGNSAEEEVVNTNDTWKVARDPGYEPLTPRTTGYYVAGPGELVRMRDVITGWEAATYDDTSWSKAQQVVQGIPKGVFTFAPVTWMLVPSMLPQLERTLQRMDRVRKVTGVNVPAAFPKTKAPVVIPANTKAEFLIDNGVLTNAYPTLNFSKGKDASISLAYAEALYIRKDQNLSGRTVPYMPKGNRNEIEGKTFVGRRDSIISNGNNNQSFTALWYRTYRYVLLRVQTAAEPLTVDDLYGTFTGYPFPLTASLQADDPSIQKNLEVGWRTARLCATETYMDCPYYEQLQYFGDTRIQALVTLFNSSDDRLVRSAIIQGDRSRLAEGVTMSRFPTASTQIIPPFSLWWIGMVHDYWMYRDDPEFIKSMLPGTREVLSFFKRYQMPDGSLKGLPYWIFTDWVTSKGWKDGVAPLGAEGNSSILDVQLMWTYQLAAQLEMELGLKDMAAEYLAQAERLGSTIRKKYWKVGRGLLADTPEKDIYSQHANALSILSGLATGSEAKAVAEKLLADQDLAPASIYFKYYVHLALVKAGFGNDYLTWLGKWNENIDMGLTTWAEMSNVEGSRSDCHAWGSSPSVEFYRIVLGIDSSAPGFKKVKFEPRPGLLKNISGTIPHPSGLIKASVALDKGKWRVRVELPATITGELVWQGKSYPLNEGTNQFYL